jgi:uncharacterized protein (TIGR03435 family)
VKKLFSCAAAGLALGLGAALPAQTITGVWQGKLPAGDNPRVVLKVEKASDGSLHGGYIRIDRSADGMPLTTVTFASPDFNVAQIYADVSYQGKVSADGRSIDGVWTQGKQTYPLTLVLATPETAWKFDGPAPVAAMSASADPAFEVATIKPTPPEGSPVIFNLRARQFMSRGTSAKELIKIAYNVRGRQVLGGPSWIEDQKFDVVAEPDTPGVPSEEQTRLMVRKLLEERFKLKVHMDQQLFPVMAVTMDKDSPALVRSDPEFNGHGSIYVKQAPDGQWQLQFAGNTIPQFIGLIMNFFQDRQLVDETGLTGLYDITLIVPAGVFQNGPSSGPGDDRGNALIQAAQKIGFRFVQKKEPLQVIVVDHLEKPSAN